MTAAHRRVALLVAAVWAAATVGVAWRALRGVDHAARSHEALAMARASRGTAPTPAWPAGLGARDSMGVRTEETPLVVRGPSGDLITAPVKDADDWDVIGAVGVAARWRERAVAVALPALAAFALAATLLLAVPTVASGVAAALAGGTAMIFGAAALTTGVRLRTAAQALAPTGTDAAVLDRVALREPSLALATLALVLLAACAALAVGAVRWHAAAAGRPVRVRETLNAWGFIAPSFVHLAVFTVAPVAFLLWISVHDWDLLASDRPFVGLAHFRELGADPLFWRALRNGLVYALYVPVTMVAALAAALLLDQPLRGIKVLRVVVFLPYVASTVAVALVWQWLLHRDFGLLNAALAAVHLPRVDWLGNPTTALPALMLVSAWGQLGYMMVVYLAGLQAIPASLLEAARLDGADAWQRFRLVVWPMLRPVSTYLLLTGIIWSFHGFTLVYVMTEGGPSHATDVLVYRIYQTAWEFRRFDVAAAMSVVLCLLLLALTALQWRTVKGEPADA
ncbi:MAG: sugar ABC transporter permease [Gemmatimonadaceae bacterium]|nr:sugar ABC transporter permease [Gemmatimonadaceae bacterium]